MRLFTALWPPAPVLAALRVAPAVPSEGGWRPVRPENLHITLCFHGEDDPVRRAEALDAALAGAPAPRLRLAGIGRFPGVLWVGVQPADALLDLAARAGADPARFRAHLTLARRSRTADRAAAPEPEPEPVPVPVPVPGLGLGPGPGPWWTPAEALLVRSDPGPVNGPGSGGPVYRTVHRVPLGR
ncbi:MULTISPECIES: 2'-5' RNA ligase family protein [Pseudonocardia]|uniref:RNA 2',3'-cyclic phosphodiesterase n=2 Tax=Pseudonocardia TaxID=1847 RepID=A0A1Y2N319_PSEAH|nr:MULTISPECIES: 2'-5' RNA ligase family protein [Pseudonocardia]OSY41298.1 2',5' RNA ligase family [Pseudonocardia autotrophica]TDN76754.1 2'-5' RNA ligase [Pseudonocardia autotrophica]BBG00755.1 RNA 2',3'-cyclic phosphodiesterase [Pseudonocardia autotrophica]GEC24279.1 RNA 2',3'-cyclic phosphodiesterase [Pseudonocardia saturnea]